MELQYALVNIKQHIDRYETYLRKKDNNDDSNTNNLSYRSKIDKLIRGGIPPSMRGKIWEYCSGADLKRKESYETNVTNNNNNNNNNKKMESNNMKKEKKNRSIS